MKLKVICESKIVGCAVFDGDKVLLIKKDGAWQLPKGHMAPGESPSQAAIRETKEETGIIPTIQNVSPYLTFFLATIKSGELEPSKKENISEAGWVTLQDALEKIIIEHVPVLKHFSHYMQK